MQGNLNKLWSTCEKIFSLNATLSEWQMAARDQFPLLRPLLRPTDKKALCYACPSPGGEGCPRHIISTKKGILAVCGDQARLCNTLRLNPEDIIVYELDQRKVTEVIARILGIPHGFAEISGLSQTWQVGDYHPAAGHRCPIFLTITTEQADLQHTANGLFGIIRQPFILIVPTRQFITLAMEDMLARIKARFMTLDEMTVWNQEELVSGSQPPEQLLASFKDTLMPDEANKATSHFSIPPAARWEKLIITFQASDVIDVKYSTMDTVTIDRLHIPGMYNQNSSTKKETMAWALLRILAQHDGMLTVQTHGSHNSLKKQKQLLSDKLKAYFQIEDDPIIWVPEQQAYKVRFMIRSNIRQVL